jgi:ubiquitin carboxyl-terminal hydrolase 16
LKRHSSLSAAINRRRKAGPDRWWRISDDKIKEGKTSDVLGMQREVYLLFYEMIDEVRP